MRALFLLLLLLCVAPVMAQDALITYAWSEGGLALDYPADWAEPLTETDADGQPVLYLSSDGTAEPNAPTITLNLAAVAPGDNLPNRLIVALAAADIETLEPPQETSLLGSPAIQISGTGAEGELFGIGQVTRVGEEQLLLVIGVAPVAQRSEFELLFTDIALTMRAIGDAAEPPVLPEYGVLWNTFRSLGDGDAAWLDLIGLAAGPDNTLYTIERVLGIIRLDAATGAVLDVLPYAGLLDPSAIGVDADGRIYVADVGCGCIHMYDADGEWSSFGEFGPDAPHSLTVSADGMVQATDIDARGRVRLLTFRDGSPIDTILLGADQFQQPVLGLDADGQSIALTQYGTLIEVRPGVPEIFNIGPIANDITGLALTANGNLVVSAADQGLIMLNDAGQIIAQPGEIVPSYPLPGEMVRPGGVVVGADGTLYFVDSDGTFGAVTALSTSVAPDRMGAVELLPGLIVQGLLDEQTGQQTWTYVGQAGERITLSAIDNSGRGLLNVALRLVGPDGVEIAFNDDQAGLDLFSPTDAQIVDQGLPGDGTYLIIVERVSGSGAYSLGLNPTRTLVLDADQPSVATGKLDEVFAADRWVFEGAAGQTLTITMQTASGLLDPLLRVVGPDSELLAENDDAGDLALGSNAQISGLTLPADGEYTIEAARFAGSGAYELIVVVTSP